MNDVVRLLLKGLAFWAVQVFLLDRVPPLHRFLTPSVYLLFLLWLPLGIGRGALLAVGFVYGLGVDLFSRTPGLHASACTLVAFLRPGLIDLLMPRPEGEGGRAEPSVPTMGIFPYAAYLVLLTLLHHTWVQFLEWLDLGDAFYFFFKVGATTALSLLLMAVTEMAFRRARSGRPADR